MSVSEPSSDVRGLTPDERAVVWIVAAVQLVNVLDFVMVMPLGPDLARAFGIPLSEIGRVSGVYTAAAAVSGLAGSLFLDRLDRRRALVWSLAGLVLGTLCGAWAQGATSFLLARVVAGLFGGPATSVALSIVADRVHVSRRGRAMGIVMGAFSIASILGVPAALELARRGAWWWPFAAVALLGAAITVGARVLLPPLPPPDDTSVASASRSSLWTRPLVWTSLLMTAAAMMAGFAVIPNLAGYVQGNLGYPREHYGTLYAIGGVASLVTMRVGGPLVDRWGGAVVGTLGTVLLSAVLAVVFVGQTPIVPVPLMFVGFMVAMGLRNVAHSTLTSRVPPPSARGRFLSIQSVVQHAASAAGAIGSASLLQTLPSDDPQRPGHMLGMSHVALVSIGLSLLLIALFWVVDQGITRREADEGR